jgi:hypothetical protein
MAATLGGGEAVQASSCKIDRRGLLTGSFNRGSVEGRFIAAPRKGPIMLKEDRCQINFLRNRSDTDSHP